MSVATFTMTSFPIVRKFGASIAISNNGLIFEKSLYSFQLTKSYVDSTRCVFGAFIHFPPFPLSNAFANTL